MNLVQQCPNGCWFHSQSSYCECPCHQGKIYGWHLPLILTIMLVASNVWASCPSGWVEWEGHCAAIPDPEHDTVKEYQPSNEKPSRHPEPAWQRGDVIADLPPSCANTRACTDDVAIEASIKGKLKAGVPLSDAETELFKTRGIASK